MRKIEHQLLEVIAAGRDFRLGNTSLNWAVSDLGAVGTVRLFGLVIAMISPIMLRYSMRAGER